jgi:hypothetical protein
VKVSSPSSLPTGFPCTKGRSIGDSSRLSAGRYLLHPSSSLSFFPSNFLVYISASAISLIYLLSHLLNLTPLFTLPLRIISPFLPLVIVRYLFLSAL